ncbi:MAG: hypothetical protein HC921_02845 [Synechococcaceae cyanobacterium SM2_3_1]|nr:hypothetical protein [Synechococcaceae cyanobacterium SM2_3_1]
MTDEELNARFAQMTDAVSRLAESTDDRVQELRENDRLLNNKFDRLVDAQLRFQDQLGEMARLMREDREDRQRRQAEQERINEESRKRHEEHEQRFNILLEEIRFMNRQRQTPES